MGELKGQRDQISLYGQVYSINGSNIITWAGVRGKEPKYVYMDKVKGKRLQ